ncbi:MAG: RNA pseudouridine synthase [Epsilonproteobacteria bacterium]|nr:MAG: RNA pseudouridine synthase [Campylobacterota bacterium]
MSKEKAYKLLSIQEDISAKKAKLYIDSGLVSIKGQKLQIARVLIDSKSVFDIKPIPQTKVIFEDDNILVVDKPAYQTAEQTSKLFKNFFLLNRLDKETSGVMLFAKTKLFQTKAIQQFKQKNVYKEYIAIVQGKVPESLTIDQPIMTTKGKTAKSKIDEKNGKPATTIVTPLFIQGKLSKLKVVIQDGRTHQIRVHLSSVGHPIVGDILYGKKSANIQRVMLHCVKTEIFDYCFEAKEPKEFKLFGFG